jgi:hypothetical protein
MGIPSEHITESLTSYDHSGAYLFTGNFPVEIADHGKYYFRYFREKSSVVAEEYPQRFKKGGNSRDRTQDYYGGCGLSLAGSHRR